jgi:methionyl-tRNA formyltransferase
MLRVAFAGTSEFAAIALAAIAEAQFTVPIVLTQPDRPAGRGLASQPSPVKRLAVGCGFPIFQPAALSTADVLPTLRAAAADVMVVAAYGHILPLAVLEIPRRGCINIHGSLLPRWRGAAPIQRALLAGDRETGITIIRMDEGMDTGPILAREGVVIGPQETSGTLHGRLAALGASMVVGVLRRLEANGIEAREQPVEGATHARKITKGEAAIDWTRDARELDRVVRAFDPSPGAFARLRGLTLKVWRAVPEIAAAGEPGRVLRVDANGILVACGHGALRLVELQKPGGRRLSARDFLAGFPIRAGDRFDASSD